MTFFIIVLILFIFYTRNSFCTVSFGEAVIIERFGVYNRTLNGGLHFIYPFIEKAKIRISLKEQIIENISQTALTKDTQKIHLELIVFFMITDPKSAVYNTDNLIETVNLISTTRIKELVEKTDYSEFFTSRSSLNNELTYNLNNLMSTYGCKINRAEIVSVTSALTTNAENDSYDPSYNNTVSTSEENTDNPIKEY